MSGALTGRVTLALTGQALIHGSLDLDGTGPAEVLAFLAAADATITNLEATTVVPGAWPTKTRTIHTCTAGALASLRALGVDVLTHANNHAFDLGPPGLLATRAAAAGAGLVLTGSGGDLASAMAPATIRGPGGSIAVLAADCGPQPDIVYASADRAGVAALRLRRRVTVPAAELAILQNIGEMLGDARKERRRARIGYRASAVEVSELFGVELRAGDVIQDGFVPDPADLEGFLAQLATTRAGHDVVVVALHSHHWGAEWERAPPWAMALQTTLLDAGADLVVGTGVPLLQPMALHAGKPLFPCMGNLVFHTRRAEAYAREGMAVLESVLCRVELGLPEREVKEILVLPVAVGGPAASGLPAGPAPLPRDAARRVLDAFCADLDPADRRLVRLA